MRKDIISHLNRKFPGRGNPEDDPNANQTNPNYIVSDSDLVTLYHVWRKNQQSTCRICLYPMENQCFVEKCFDTCCYKCVNLWLEEYRRCPMCYRYPNLIFTDIMCVFMKNWKHSDNHEKILMESRVKLPLNWRFLTLPDEPMVLYYRVMELPPVKPGDM